MSEQDDISLPFITRNQLAFKQGATFQLRVKLVATVTSNVELTGYTKEGPFVFRTVHAGDGSISTLNFSIPDMPIAVAMSTSAQGTLKGRVYARIMLVINGVPIQELTRGYVHDLGSPAWPSGYVEESSPLRSYIQVVDSANPAAGAEISYTLGDNVNWRLMSANITLVTDATATNRRVHLLIDQDQWGLPQNFFGDIDQTASTTRTYHFEPIGFSEDREDNGHIIIPIPQNLYIMEQSIISTVTTNLQAGDNLGLLNMVVEQFLSR